MANAVRTSNIWNYLFLLFCVWKLVASDRSQSVARIFGGQVTSISKVPYIVQLRSSDMIFCAGSLVTPKFVVTAAHCIVGESGVVDTNFIVVGGATFFSDKGVQRDLRSIYIPKTYNIVTLDMDVAVLELESPMIGKHIETIGLSSKSLKVGDNLKISGWGDSEYNELNILRSATVSVVSKDWCTKMYERIDTELSRSMFCAYIPGRKDACQGDSGGPAVLNGELYGIISWGMGCADDRYPGVYTDINAVKNFIINAIQR